ncbi:hypothetical protein FHS16_003168 [Paenibacillus endophyticus]|uniref:Uncharacterized protein n=1 Tax=Paenibacillus endophyticus TaxID=1294268 RepID=A0A7W5CAF9_9BACL|nr:hypothetical protein [Paenibacillus endophyticus]
MGLLLLSLYVSLKRWRLLKGRRQAFLLTLITFQLTVVTGCDLIEAS